VWCDAYAYARIRAVYPIPPILYLHRLFNMPTVNVKRDLLFQLIGKTFSDKEFDDLCFQYGIELDSVTTEKELASKAPVGEGATQADGTASSPSSSSSASDDVIIYKIEIPANRYDLLCVEGLSRALRVFLELESHAPTYKVINPPPAQRLRIVQRKTTSAIRPYVVGAVLRDMTFTPPNFASFIDLQDKLHQNIGRKRTLVAIGTHDLDTIKHPFTYEAKEKRQIRFQPLSEEKEFDVIELFEHYQSKANSHLKPYLHITENAPLHPVIYDSQGIVCSLPPIINGEHSKITLNTRNVLIECTGTDLTKLHITLNQVVTMFSHYCAKPYEVEAVEVMNEETGNVAITPNLDCIPFDADVDYINSAIGINLTADEMVTYFKKMSMESSIDESGKKLRVLVPPTRSDVLHACDLMEDIAISYGFNRVPRTMPQCYTQGKFNKLNALSDSIREQVAQSGFNEVLTWVLLSFDDNYRFMQPKDVQGEVMDIKAITQAHVPCATAATAAASDGAAAPAASGVVENARPLIIHPYLANPRPITLANPKSLDFQLVRTTLLPGLLKALSNNQGQVNLPIRLFECGDIGFQCSAAESDTGARNERHVAGLYCDVRSGFEVIQGLVDRIMQVNGIYFAPTVKEYRAKRAKIVAKREAAAKAAAKAEAAAEKKKAKAKKKGPADEQKQDAQPAAAAPAASSSSHHEDELEEEWKVSDTYSIRRSSHPSYFPSRAADIVLHRSATNEEIIVGTFGVLHPDVITQFQIPYVCSAMEINIEHFL